MRKSSLFTRKHYTEIAKVLKELNQEQVEYMFDSVTIGKVALRLAQMFQADNPNFSEDVFAEAIYKETSNE